MSSIQRPQPRFAGYRLTQDGKKADIYLPKHHGVKLENLKAEAILPGKTMPEAIDMQPEGDYYWVSKKPVPLGTDYRFRINDTDKVEIATGFNGQVQLKPATLNKKNGTWQFKPPVPAGVEMICEIPAKPGLPKLRAERVVSGQNPVHLNMCKETSPNGEAKWVFTDTVPAGEATYRLSPELEQLEVTQHHAYGSFNRISPHEGQSPQRSTVIADIFQDSAVTPERLRTLEEAERGKGNVPREPHLGVLPLRNHFNQFAATPQGGQEAALEFLLDPLQQAGFSGVLFKPFVGGDSLSSHHYWTNDPYVLNNTFSNKKAMSGFLKGLLRRDMKLVADGAYVNGSLNGVQSTDNLVNGFSSSSWRWLKQGDENVSGGAPSRYPALAHRKLTLGILPTKRDPKTGIQEVDYSRFDIRILNDPESKSEPYNPKKPTYIELYDPRLTADGTKPIIKSSTDSVQNYRFPVDPKEVIAKRKTFDLPNHPASHKEAFLEWKRFRLGKPSQDNSGVKWDGQVDAAMLNTQNEEVVNYLKGAVAYWSRFVMNTQIGNVTEALHGAQRQALSQFGEKGMQAALKEDPLFLVNAITQAQPPTLKGVEKLLPVRAVPGLDLTPAELKQIEENTVPGHALAENGKTFAGRLLNEVPLSVLPLPTIFKATLSYPGLAEALNPTKREGFANTINHTVLANLSRLPVLGHLFKALRNLIFPMPFQKNLARKMNEIFTQMDAGTQEKLRYGQMQSLLADRVGETLYLSLLTGLQPDQVKALKTGQQVEDAFYEGMPLEILQADPVVASKLLPKLLNQRLKSLSSHQMAKLVETEMANLDPKLAAVSNALLQKMEAGLNWRIDAARDVGNMSRVFDAPSHERPKIFLEEIERVKRFWDKLTGAMRAPFPKASVIAELTDFELLANENKSENKAVSEAAMKSLFENNTFTSTPNMSFMYSPLMQLVYYAQRPDEYGNTQIGPSKFLENVRRMSEAVPFPALRQFQNMTASHDYPTSSHVMLINPELFTMDLLKWWGLKDDLTVAADELQSKACFGESRSRLARTGVDDVQLKSALYRLRKILERPETQKALKDEQLRTFYDKDTKGQSQATYRPTPPALKGRFVEAVLQNLKPEDLALQNPAQMTTLKSELQARISEPSEAKAMRGTIVNAALDLNLPDAEKQALWNGLDKAIAKWGQHFGYQPLDVALNHVFAEIPEAKFANGLEQTKLALYKRANQPVMDHLQKLFAVQSALPGNPSVYLPDLLAQAGSEWTKNMFLQNRNLIHTDKLDPKTQSQYPEFHAFYQNVGKIFGARTKPEMLKNFPQLQALNDGIVVSLTPEEESGILPIVRDNGRHQVVTLVNTGTPKKLSFENKTGLGPRYDSPERNLRTTPYQPNFAELGLPADTAYIDVNTKERFKLNGEGRLQPENNPSGGVMDAQHPWRILVRA